MHPNIFDSHTPPSQIPMDDCNCSFSFPTPSSSRRSRYPRSNSARARFRLRRKTRAQLSSQIQELTKRLDNLGAAIQEWLRNTERQFILIGAHCDELARYIRLLTSVMPMHSRNVANHEQFQRIQSVLPTYPPPLQQNQAHLFLKCRSLLRRCSNSFPIGT
jgi:hypothetical protein